MQVELVPSEPGRVPSYSCVGSDAPLGEAQPLPEWDWLWCLLWGAHSLILATTWSGTCKQPRWAENWRKVSPSQLVSLLMAHSLLPAFSVPASDSFICTTSIKRTSHASGMGERARAVLPLQKLQAL